MILLVYPRKSNVVSMGSLQFSTLSMSARCTTHNGCNTAPTRGGSEKCMVGGGRADEKCHDELVSPKFWYDVIWCDMMWYDVISFCLQFSPSFQSDHLFLVSEQVRRWPQPSFRALPAGLHEQHDHLQRGQGELTSQWLRHGFSLWSSTGSKDWSFLMSPWCLFKPCFRIMLITLWWFMLVRVNAVGGDKCWWIV